MPGPLSPPPPSLRHCFKGDWHAYACVYSSQAGGWLPSVHLDVGVQDYCRGHLELSRPVIVGDGIYLALEWNARIAILKYDLRQALLVYLCAAASEPHRQSPHHANRGQFAWARQHREFQTLLAVAYREWRCSSAVGDIQGDRPTDSVTRHRPY